MSDGHTDGHEPVTAKEVTPEWWARRYAAGVGVIVSAFDTTQTWNFVNGRRLTRCSGARASGSRTVTVRGNAGSGEVRYEDRVVV